MKAVHVLSRSLLAASLVLLAACQSMPGKSNVAANGNVAANAEKPAAPATVQASSQGASVAVFLADTKMQSGWTPVKIQAGTLYVNPQPILTRDDLTGIKAGTNKAGEGLLALALNDAGQKKVTDITTQNPNKRLALVVGRTMMAAPGYTTPVKGDQLVFPVGTEQNATAAAKAIAGPSAIPDAPQGSSSPASPASSR